MRAPILNLPLLYRLFSTFLYVFSMFFGLFGSGSNFGAELVTHGPTRIPGGPCGPWLRSDKGRESDQNCFVHLGLLYHPKSTKIFGVLHCGVRSS